jgi:hypothetical protein
MLPPYNQETSALRKTFLSLLKQKQPFHVDANASPPPFLNTVSALPCLICSMLGEREERLEDFSDLEDEARLEAPVRERLEAPVRERLEAPVRE